MAYYVGHDKYNRFSKTLATAPKTNNGGYRIDARHWWKEPFAHLAKV